MACKTAAWSAPASPSSLISYGSLPSFCDLASLANFAILWTCQTCFQLMAFPFAVSHLERLFYLSRMGSGSPFRSQLKRILPDNYIYIFIPPQHILSNKFLLVMVFITKNPFLHCLLILFSLFPWEQSCYLICHTLVSPETRTTLPGYIMALNMYLFCYWKK